MTRVNRSIVTYTVRRERRQYMKESLHNDDQSCRYGNSFLMQIHVHVDGTSRITSHDAI
jgi:hypothetical protein